jgi:integrase
LETTDLSKWELEAMRKIISEIHRERFKKNCRIYRGVNRTFKDNELDLFLTSIEKLPYKVLFSLMAYCGFRVGEVVKIKLSDINLEQRQIKILTEKQRLKVIDIHPFPDSLIILLKLYIQKYRNRMELHQGYFFPQDKANNKPINPECARKAFAYYRRKLFSQKFD